MGKSNIRRQQAYNKAKNNIHDNYTAQSFSKLSTEEIKALLPSYYSEKWEDFISTYEESANKGEMTFTGTNMYKGISSKDWAGIEINKRLNEEILTVAKQAGLEKISSKGKTFYVSPDYKYYNKRVADYGKGTTDWGTEYLGKESANNVGRVVDNKGVTTSTGQVTTPKTDTTVKAAPQQQQQQSQQYTKNGQPIDPTKFTNLTPGTTDFNNYLREQGIVEVGEKPDKETNKKGSFETSVSKNNSILTNEEDVVANFSKFIGREPTTEEDWANIYHLMTKSPTEVESSLKTSASDDITPTVTDKTIAKKEEDQSFLEQIPDDVEQKIFDAFGRFPTEQDVANYLHNPDLFNKQLEDELAKKTQKEEVEAVAIEEKEVAIKTAEEQDRIKTALKIIDDAEKAGTIPPDIAELWRTTVNMYPPGVEFSAGELLKTFEDIKTSTIDPYFDELTDVAISDFQTAFGQQEKARGLETEAEKAGFESETEQAKAGLEARGMTFSGEAVKKLGTESAFEAKPFGGIAEGTLQQKQRLMISSSEARNKSALQALGRQAENFLGTEEARKLNIPFESAGVSKTGELATGREQKEAETLQSLISQYEETEKAKLNI